MTTIQEILFELNSFADVTAKRMYLEEHLKDIVDSILEMEDNDRAVYVEKLLDVFEGSRVKGTVKKVIEAAIANEVKRESKNRIGEFSDVDIEKLVQKNGTIIPTPSNIYQLLLNAKSISLVYDTMSANIYFEKMPWQTNAPSYKIEYYGGEPKYYYKYQDDNNTMLKIELNKGPLPTEINFKGLDEVVEEVAKAKTFDAYKDWMWSYKSAFDGNDYINDPNTNFAVKYLGVAPGPWSVVWCRTLMLNLVARADKPGCQTRHYFVIEGEQNIGKSSWCKLLVPEQWFISTGLTQAQTNEDNFNRSIHDKGVIELAEMGGFHKAEQNQQKKIVTDTHATFRKMRANPVIQYPKHCIMIVTTNETKYLRDASGESRPVPIKSELKRGTFFDLEGFKSIYPMLLAQAIDMYERNPNLRYVSDEEQELQKLETDERETIDDTWDFDEVSDYIALNKDKCDEFGISYKDVTEYLKAKHEMPMSALIRHRNTIGIAIKKLGYNNMIVAKEKDENGIWKSVKRWKK